jgi:phosphatidylglycerophosphatase A
MRLNTVPPLPDSMWKKPTHFIAFGFGTGALPVAPGTFGTLIAIPFYLAIQSLHLSTYIAIVLLITLGSIWLCDKVTKEIGIHDHQGMCLDEIVGYLVTMCGAPHGWQWVVIGFLLFRLFDIWKPQPIRYIDEHVSGGFGIILDDLLAAVYSCIILHIISWTIGS